MKALMMLTVQSFRITAPSLSSRKCGNYHRDGWGGGEKSIGIVTHTAVTQHGVSRLDSVSASSHTQPSHNTGCHDSIQYRHRHTHTTVTQHGVSRLDSVSASSHTHSRHTTRGVTTRFSIGIVTHTQPSHNTGCHDSIQYRHRHTHTAVTQHGVSRLDSVSAPSHTHSRHTTRGVTTRFSIGIVTHTQPSHNTGCHDSI
ncbi:hypothetical protein ACOMHN_044243 [Nucella lapillus]